MKPLPEFRKSGPTAIYHQYRPLVDHVGRREDLNALLVEMIAEMQVGHNRTGGGDERSFGKKESAHLR